MPVAWRWSRFSLSFPLLRLNLISFDLEVSSHAFEHLPIRLVLGADSDVTAIAGALSKAFGITGHAL